MKTRSKLASLRSDPQDPLLHRALRSARRLIDVTAERSTTRPLRDIDDWSDQSEIAYYEELYTSRA